MADLSFEINGSTNLYALIGSPVRHSLSPLIYNTSFNGLGMNSAYVAFDVRNLAEALIGMKALGFRGYNVTVPYKEAVLQHLDELSAEAKIIGSVNTVVSRDSKWIGHNTDAAGFTKSLESYREEINGESILVLGAGGGARAVIYALITNYGPREIIIHNRSIERGKKLANEFSRLSPNVHLRYAASDGVRLLNTKLVINATSVGLTSEDSPISSNFFRPGMIAYDLIYNPSETVFLQQARDAGAKGINGMEMLIKQAAAAFTLWTGAAMPVELIRKYLSKKVDNY